MFDGMLGTCNTTSVYLELKDYSKTVCLRPYPLPRLHKAMFKKWIKILVSLGVLEEANDSKWGSLYFAQPKVKTNCVRFLSDFWNLNMQLKCKPYPISTIREMILKTEGFKYDTSLDLNMGYYHIHLSEEARNLCTIILPWGKYRYRCLPMFF